jgi:hypothetical protein
METTFTISSMSAKPSSIDLRRKNIKYLFVNTIHSMNVVIEKYDYCFSRLCAFSKNKHDYHILHKRALQECIKLLT